MEDNLDILGDCVMALNGSNQSLTNINKSFDKILYPDSINQEQNEFERLSKIIKLKKVYKIYPISYINEQISNYNDIKNSKILNSIEIFEKLNELKTKEKDRLNKLIELLENKLEQFVNYKKSESIINSVNEDLNEVDDLIDLNDEEKKQLEIYQEEINSIRFQVSKLQLQKVRKY